MGRTSETGRWCPVESWRPRECAMRLALWRRGKERAQAEEPVARPAPTPPRLAREPAAATQPGDIDLHALGAALSRKRGWIIVPTVLAAALSITTVNLIPPRYKSEARILID